MDMDKNIYTTLYLRKKITLEPKRLCKDINETLLKELKKTI